MEISQSELVLIMGAVVAGIRLLEEGLKLGYKLITKNGNGKQDSKQDISIAILNTKMEQVLSNHLPHIEQRLERVENKQDLLLEKMIELLKK